jgi:hypothetical protein
MEQENKKIRDKARKERNEVVRNLVSFIRYGILKPVVGDVPVYILDPPTPRGKSQPSLS